MKKIFLLAFLLVLASLSFGQKRYMVLINTEFTHGFDSLSSFSSLTIQHIDTSVSQYVLDIEICFAPKKFPVACSSLVASGMIIDTSNQTKRDFLVSYLSNDDYLKNKSSQYFIFSPDIYVIDKGVKKFIVIPCPIQDLKEITDEQLFLLELALRLHKEIIRDNQTERQI